jgi:hypothetical protein
MPSEKRLRPAKKWQSPVWSARSQPQWRRSIRNPKEEVEVETIGALEHRYGDWHLAIGRRRQPKRRTQGDCGSRKKLAATRIQMTHCAIPAWHKGHGHKGLTVEKRRQKNHTKDNVVRGTPAGQTFEKRCWARSKRNNGIRDRGLRWELCLGSKEIFYEALGQISGLEVV